VKIHIQAIRAKVHGYGQVAAREATELLRRRRISYAALALTLAAGSLYLSGIRPVLVTGSQPPKSTTDDRSPAQNQVEPLQAMTGQSDANPGGASSQGSSNQQQSSTSVTVNGTDIPVPANGEIHKTVTNSGGTTSVSVSHDSSGDSSYSSLDVQVFSHSTASQEGD